MAVNVLKYLFTVLYKDNSTFQQDPSDISSVDPKRSSFTDAITKIENNQFVLAENGEPVSRLDEISRFQLMGQDEQGVDHTYMVDLLTGHFEIDLIQFRIHRLGEEYVGRRLVFFRRHFQDILCHPDAKTELGKHRIVYVLGWQANTLDGENVQFVIEID